MVPRKRSGWWGWLWVALLIGGAYGGWSYYKKRVDTPINEYRTATIGRGDLVQSVTANGQLSAVKNVTVGSQVSGIITDIRVDFNSLVTNGQVIAQIDPSTYEQNITQAKAELANAEAALRLAEVESRRNLQLFNNSLISAAEHDQSVAALQQAQAVVQTREASLRRAQVDLQRTTIYAPIDGIVITRAVDVGQTVAASFNAPTLFNIANDLRQMRIEAMVSEADVGGIEEGQRVNFTVEAFPERQFRGRVTQVRYAPVTNQNVVTYTTVVDVNNDDLKLRPGMTATASIITAEARDVLRVPNAALRFRPPDTAVVEGRTNASPAGGTAPAGARPRAGEQPGGGEPPNREEMRRRFESMTPEQREQFRALRRDRDGGGPQPAAGRRTRTVYVVSAGSAEGKAGPVVLKPVPVGTGISDGAYTEVLEGLKEGDVVVTGLVVPATAAAPGGPPGSPFGRPFGGGFRGR